ncbi:unnamed protein product [Acanthoscelides obtectus]|uniref:Uncharacterized protein n=1 Tax=Acanthoscelides obtectus TaxID=200917 RepID=A0A9P0LUY9_ACAOB|nr:unnamed protein product [Acanthoscelides obtectus]CAK1627229.1 hypothetical protein AOBTE_LOCUS4413 [Acanthoscelides obtectus]
MGDGHQEQISENRLKKRWRDGNSEIRNKTGKLMNCPVSYIGACKANGRSAGLIVDKDFFFEKKE